MKLHLAALLTLCTPALAQSLPNPALTPGAINPAVTQENINQTICMRGWTRTVRPPEEYTHQLKRCSIEQYGDADHRLNQYEFDHLIPLEIGGAPADPRNLWPEPMIADDGWRADDKDLLERTLNHLVCSGRLSLVDAQAAIAGNWEDAFNRFVVGE
jgi:hypothetical protein